MTDQTDKQDKQMLAVARAAEELALARHGVEEATEQLHREIRAAVELGTPSARVAKAAGVSAGRVSQLAPVPKHAQPPIHAQKSGAEPVCVTPADTVPTLPDASVASLSGYASQRRRNPNGKPTMFYDVLNGYCVDAVTNSETLASEHTCGPYGSISNIIHAAVFSAQQNDNPIGGRVYLTGPLPGDPSSGATSAESVRAWALTSPPEGWRVADRGHYLHDASLPVLRFVDDAGRKLTIMRAASWWQESDAPAYVCAAAWRGLGSLLDEVKVFRGAGLADTPATTGRALWLRTIPENTSYPVLGDELRELIHATSGQGRIQLLPDPQSPAPLASRRPADTVGFTYLDGRFMYAALTWGMPVGEPRRWTGQEFSAADWATQESALRGRGRWRITATVPADWAHVGMLMAPADRGWQYPAEPGQTFTTWADGSEVYAAMQHGWTSITIHEGITWAEGKPLNTWRDALVAAWAKANESDAPAAALAAKAVRSILITAIGTFAHRTHNTTGSCPADQPEQVPADALPGSVRRVGDSLVWESAGVLSSWSAETAHPEWAATIWARARTRLLTAKGVGTERVGALHLPPERVIAFSTDALYVAGGSPGWADDGQPGRFRVKGTRAGAFTWPADRNALYALRDEAEQ